MAARMHSLNQQCSSSSSSIAADHKHLAPNSCIRLQRAPAHFSLPLLHSRHATSALKATGGEEYTSGAVTSVAAALSVVVVPQAAAELYKALVGTPCSLSVSSRAPVDHQGHSCILLTCIVFVVFVQQPKRCQCCVGTGFVLCSSCQGRGKQVS